MAQLLVRVLAVCFVAAVPILLVSTAVAWAVNDLRLYSYEFRLQGVAEDTGMTEEELLHVARYIRAYFNSRQGPLKVSATVGGKERELFNPREVRHMADVKRLVWGVYGVQWATGLYVVTYIVAGLSMWRRPFLRRVALLALWGSGLTVVLVLAVGIAALVSFDRLFLLFHWLSFRNLLWQLAPDDYLVRIFPAGFWFDATFSVGLATIAMAGVLALAAGIYLWLVRARP